MRWDKKDVKEGQFFGANNTTLPYNICCVYKIYLEGGFFYIGHTGCLRKRIMGHMSFLRNPSETKYGFYKKAKDKKILMVEILGLCKTVIHANELEIVEFDKNFDNPLMLNSQRPTLRSYKSKRRFMDELRASDPDLAEAIEARFPSIPQANSGFDPNLPVP